MIKTIKKHVESQLQNMVNTKWPILRSKEFTFHKYTETDTVEEELVGVREAAMGATEVTMMELVVTKHCKDKRPTTNDGTSCDRGSSQRPTMMEQFMTKDQQ